jgi:hypothetical protein
LAHNPPARFDSVAPGLHTILVKKKGYFIKKITTTLSPDSLHEIYVILLRPGGLAVKTEPAGATVYIDSKEVGATPYENAKLKPGRYAIRLERPHYQTVEQFANVSEGACDTVDVTMPLLKSYSDSIDAAQKETARKKKKFKRIIDLSVIGAFLIYGIIIFLIEAGNAD